MILRNILDNNLYNFVEDKVDTWEEAIFICCKALEESGIVDDQYAQKLIDQINEHGPYIVLLPNLAMPHTSSNVEGVFDTAIGFTWFKYPISFDPDDPSKDAQTFFTLAAVDEMKHLDNMASLFDLLSQGDTLEQVMDIHSLDDLIDVVNTLEQPK